MAYPSIYKLLSMPFLLMILPMIYGQCPEGTYQDGITCFLCHFQCKRCSGPLSADCLSCHEGTHLQNDRTCKQSCPQGQYSLPDNIYECFPCDSSCKECKGGLPNNCTECFNNSQPNVDGSCPSACPREQQFDTPSKECKPCTSDCDLCRGSGVNECLRCSENYFNSKEGCVYPCPKSAPFYNYENFSCVSHCPSNTYLYENSLCIPTCLGYQHPSKPNIDKGGNCESCGDNCFKCDESMPNTCSICYKEAPYLQDGHCQAQCNDGYLPVIEPIHQNPTTEHTGFYANQYICIRNCPDGSYYDPALLKCIRCASTCVTCKNNSSTCTSCSQQEQLFNGKCLRVCPRGYYNYGNRCLEYCPRGTQYADYRTCGLCDPRCKSCQGNASLCTT